MDHWDNQVTFTINGNIHHVNGSNVDEDTSLTTYIRNHAGLKGTKWMCMEGGCGCCMVMMTETDPATGHDRSFAVSSCLVPVFSCHGVAITTIEGIGNKHIGYHKIQKALYTFNGTQCGYCSPAQIMNMYSLLKCNPEVKMEEIENSFGSSLCRCTGYRPILDAFKSFASDAPKYLRDKLSDIEDLDKWKIGCNQNYSKNKNNDGDDDYSPLFLETSLVSKKLHLKLSSGSSWYRVSKVEEVFQLFDMIGDAKYLLVAGNTAKCVYKRNDSPAAFIDINGIKGLKIATLFPDYIVLGGNITLTDLKAFFQKISLDNPLFYGYTKGLADHLDQVASVPLRNRATLAGNLMIKHQKKEFPSDLFVILEACGAKITIRDCTGLNLTITLLEFLETDMNKKLILNFILPALSNNHYNFQSFKVMARRQNVHATVNAGFLFRILSSNRYIVEEQPRIVFGHISPNFTHAFNTEAFLTGKSLLDASVFRDAKYRLAKEIQPSQEPVDEPSTNYRKQLAIALFYRFILKVNGVNASRAFRSGATNLMRPLSSGKQEFPSSTKEPPVHQPRLKLEGLAQCSGEAEFVDDIPCLPGLLFGALVITDRVQAKIISIDTSSAMEISGVVAFFSAKDIPGINSFAIIDNNLTTEEEELFCKEDVKYAGQPVGIIVAKTHEIAIKAAKLVKIKYSTIIKPLLTIKDVLNSGEKSRVVQKGRIDPISKGGTITHKISGEFEMGSQFHFTLEPHVCFCIPKEDELDVYSSTQWMHNTQAAIAKVLGVKMNSVNLYVKRLGGAFGGKVTRSAMVASACCLAAHKLTRPVKLVVDLETTMKAIGKRCFYLATYEVGVDDNGKVQYLTAILYENMGFTYNDNTFKWINDGIRNCYDVSTWTVDFNFVKTDLASSTWMRAPGTLEGLATIEHIMEHIAAVCKKDPISVRRINFSEPSSQLIENVIQELITSSEFYKRLANINQFNKVNRWKKRGIALMPMRFGIFFFSSYYSTVSIFYDDGTVAISTGGIEIGQGINTKVAQVCAYALGIDISLIKIKPCYNLISPNNESTAGNIGTDSVSYATLKCCEELNKRLKPIREKIKNPSWSELIKSAYEEGVDLKATYMYSTSDPIPKDYSNYGAAVLEVEVDILTGQHQIPRVDIEEDLGESLNQLVDIGQIEGAFAMGLGYFFCERIAFDEKNGSLKTNRAWNYWPPGPKDIPIDFRVTIKNNTTNPIGVLGSKATGEPSICTSFTLVNALRMALQSARKDAGLPDEWFSFNPPCTFENTCLSAASSVENFIIRKYGEEGDCDGE
nr:xanthine dehydrogenase-like isoform X2 [Halyomorpha halys]